MGFDIDCVGYSAAVLEGEVGGAVDEAHRAAVGVFVGDEVVAVAPLPEVGFAAIGFLYLFVHVSSGFLSFNEIQ